MKDVPAVNWPMPLADLAHPDRWPLRGRNDPSAGMPPEATLTPAADQPQTPEEVPDDCQLELPGADDEGSVGSA